MTNGSAREISLDMIDYINRSYSAAYAVEETARRLDEAGYKRLYEKDRWDPDPGDKFYVIRRFTSIIAGKIGAAPYAESGLRIVGAHTDSPGFRLKPNAVYGKNGYVQAGVEIYGGPILATFADRDLGIAGRLVYEKKDGSYGSALAVLDGPVCRIPNVAIHLNRDVNNDGLKLHKQDHLPPVIGMANGDEVEEYPLIEKLAQSAGIDPLKVKKHWLELFDSQPGAIGGLNGEFVFSRRIDNLASCHAGLNALLESPDDTEFTQIIALWDNEEVGSSTLNGAMSTFLDDVLERLIYSNGHDHEDFHRARDLSIIVSADGAHGVNPNYADSHDPKHMPVLNGGPVIKVNAMERYATTPESSMHLEECAWRAGVTLQTFVSRTDKPCGSTIGPMTATRMGILTVDMGTPMIGMHSAREMGGIEDQADMIAVLREHLSK
jgi:aspartyl aminopeptidase